MPSPHFTQWTVAHKAIDDWGKTARFCVILVVSAICTVAVVLVIALTR